MPRLKSPPPVRKEASDEDEDDEYGESFEAENDSPLGAKLSKVIQQRVEENERAGNTSANGDEDVEDEDAPATGPYEYAMVFKNVENKDGTFKQSDMATACYHALTDAGNFQYYL